MSASGAWRHEVPDGGAGSGHGECRKASLPACTSHDGHGRGIGSLLLRQAAEIGPSDSLARVHKEMGLACLDQRCWCCQCFQERH